MNIKRTLLLGLILACGLALQARAELSRGSKLAIFATTDTTDYGLAKPLQDGLAQLAASTRLFQTGMRDYGLNGFTTRDIAEGLTKSGADIISFVYIENLRISVFFFARSHIGEFIVSSKLLNEPPKGKMTSEYIELQFRAAFQEVMALYLKNEYQPLPGSKFDPQQLKLAERREMERKSNEAKRLFRELAMLDYRPVYVGANVGMSRFDAGSRIASSVDFGGYFGYHPKPYFGLELGVDLFTYAFLHADARYLIPWAEKYVQLSLSAGATRCMKHVSDNQGFATERKIPVGTLGVGPGFAFDIPLLGANLRGEVRYYFGNAPLLMGTYGILYSL